MSGMVRRELSRRPAGRGPFGNLPENGRTAVAYTQSSSVTQPRFAGAFPLADAHSLRVGGGSDGPCRLSGQSGYERAAGCDGPRKIHFSCSMTVPSEIAGRATPVLLAFLAIHSRAARVLSSAPALSW